MNDLDSIYLRARELPPGALPAFLDKACAGKPEIRAQIEEMLQHASLANHFFEHAATKGDSPSSKSDPLAIPQEDLVPGEKEGATIGRYKLLQRIGEGGMGVVYMAEQEVPVRRRVALKIVKLGMDTKAVVARFEAERQALAMMDHPNIAKVLDAGATDSGRPYFVMELVQGVPITEYCDQNHLSLRERIDLFIPVCKAIQSAHQKGVIHRDIKPSNVMVTLHYGDPTPKVIDFGVAKATSQRLTEKTVFTRYGTMIGTPAYMSPEQAEMSSLDVDTRSDVYSLGVLLYELITGTTPFPQERLRSLGFGEMQRVIAEEEPETPSTRVSTMVGRTRTTNPNRRGVGHGSGIDKVVGDLDWIVMKCLEKDRRRRYDTPNELVADLERHRENEPVSARPPSTAYRLQKAFRRNQVGFIAAGAVAMALVVGFGIATWQAWRARRAEAVAEQRLAEAQGISKFLIDVFQSPNPSRSGYSYTVAEAIGSAAKKLEIELTNQPQLRVQLQATLAETYQALGLHREAIPLQEQVREFELNLHGPNHPSTLEALNALADSYFESNRRPEAFELYKQVMVAHAQLEGPVAPSTLQAKGKLATQLFYDRKYSEATQLQQEIFDVMKASKGPEHPDTLGAMHNLAVTLGTSGQKAKALALHTQLYEIRLKALGPEHLDTIESLGNLAVRNFDAGNDTQGLQRQRELITLRRKVQGPEHPQTLMAMHYLAYFVQSKDPLEGVRLHEEVLTLRRRVLGPEHPDTLISLYWQAIAYANLGQMDRAQALREEMVKLRRKIHGPEHPQTLGALTALADGYVAANRTRQALPHWKMVTDNTPAETSIALKLTTLQAWFNQGDEFTAASRHLLRRATAETNALRLARFATAINLMPSPDRAQAESNLDLAKKALALNLDPSRSAAHRLAVGMSEYRLQHFSAAFSTLEAITKESQNTSTTTLTAAFFQCMSLVHLGRREEAHALFQSVQSKLRPLPRDPENPLREGVREEDLTAWIASKEAASLLQLSGPRTP